MNKVLKTFLLVVTGVSLLALTGCVSSNDQQLSVTLSNTLKGDTVQVDVAGIKQDQIGYYSNMQASQYWSLDSKIRNKLAKRTLLFYPGRPATEVIPSNSPVWDLWDVNGDDYLLIAADLPPTVANSINWKLIIPMPYYWDLNFWSSRNGNFVVDTTGLTYVD